MFLDVIMAFLAAGCASVTTAAIASPGLVHKAIAIGCVFVGSGAAAVMKLRGRTP